MEQKTFICFEFAAVSRRFHIVFANEGLLFNVSKVYNLLTQTQTYEIILTLGQAFEVAYQMAIQSRARQYVPPSSLTSELIETKTSRPMSQSWSSMRRSAVSTTLQNSKENMVNVCECGHCVGKVHRAHGRLLSADETPYWAAYKARFLPLVESDDSFLCYQFLLAHPPNLSHLDQRGFSICAYVMNEEFYMPAGCLISSGTLQRARPPSGPTHRPASLLHKC